MRLLGLPLARMDFTYLHGAKAYRNESAMCVGRRCQGSHDPETGRYQGPLGRAVMSYPRRWV